MTTCLLILHCHLAAVLSTKNYWSRCLKLAEHCSFHIKYIDFHFKEDLLSDNDLFQKTPPKSPVSIGLNYAWLIPELVTHSNLFKFYSFGHWSKMTLVLFTFKLCKKIANFSLSKSFFQVKNQLNLSYLKKVTYLLTLLKKLFSKPTNFIKKESTR